jgi:glycerophosphoryl diester phosphodiesterase
MSCVRAENIGGGMVYKVLCGVLGMVLMVHGRSCLVVGHRGACGLETENTLASFSKALELGVDMIELDVHVCKTGELVVHHDCVVDRLTDGTGCIVDKTRDQLQTLCVRGGHVIPTLDEVFELVDRRCVINIELKGAGTGKALARFLLPYFRGGWSVDDILVTSFDMYELHDFRMLLPEVPTGIIFDCLPIDYALRAKQLGVQNIMMRYNAITPELMRAAHMSDLRVFVWTVNKVNIAQKMVDYGVHGIITDYPDRIMLGAC